LEDSLKLPTDKLLINMSSLHKAQTFLHHSVGKWLRYLTLCFFAALGISNKWVAQLLWELKPLAVPLQTR
jgi:hypothetical protein